MELQDYLRALRNHWVGVLIIVVLCVAAAAGYTATRTKVYAASSSAIVGTGQSDNTGLASLGDTLAKSRATTYVDVAKSRAVAQGVIDQLHLSATPASLVGSVSVTQPVDTAVLEITAKAATPQAAQAIADAWVTSLGAQVKEIESPKGAPGDGVPRIVPMDQAALPTAPVSPNPKRNLALGLIIGLLLGLGYAVLRTTLDRRLRTVQDIEEKLKLPVVGAIPGVAVLKHERAQRAALAVTASLDAPGASAAAEAFRKIRTNLMFMNVDDPVRAVVISSARPGDGKSTVAANVAAALATNGQEVVLLDADLRRPTVATAFDVDDAVGVSNVLSGQVKYTDALQTVAEIPGLYLMTAGTAAPNPSELLGSQAMKSLIASLSEDAFVVLDAPPLLPVTDAALLSTACDGVILVVSSGHTLDTDAQTCVNSIDAVNGKVLGLILNRVQPRNNPAGYYGYKRYGSYGAYYAPRTEREARAKEKVGKRAKPSAD